MKRELLLSLVAFMAMGIFSAEAQVGRLINRAVDAATRAAEREVTREVESASEQAVMNMFERMRGPDSAAAGGGMFGEGFDISALMSGGEVTLEHESEYRFDGRIVMEMETFTEDEPSGKLEYVIFFDAGGASSAIKLADPEAESQDESMLFVTDSKNSVMLMLTDSEDARVGLITSIREEVLVTDHEEAEEEVAEYEGDVRFRRTGNTKMIAGYECEEYVATSEEDDTEVSMWFTRDLSLDIGSQTLATAGMPLWFGSSEFAGGYLLEMESREEGSVTMRMVTREIDQSAGKVIDISSFELIQVGR